MTDTTRDEAVAKLTGWIDYSQGSRELQRMATDDKEARQRDAQLLIGRHSRNNPAFAGILAEVVDTDPNKQDEVSSLADALAEMKVKVAA